MTPIKKQKDAVTIVESEPFVKKCFIKVYSLKPYSRKMQKKIPEMNVYANLNIFENFD